MKTNIIIFFSLIFTSCALVDSHEDLKKRNKGYLFDKNKYQLECSRTDSIINMPLNPMETHVSDDFKSAKGYIPYWHLGYKDKEYSAVIKEEGQPQYEWTDSIFHGYRYSSYFEKWVFPIHIFVNEDTGEDTSDTQRFYRVSKKLNIIKGEILGSCWVNENRYLELYFLIDKKDTTLVEGFQAGPYFSWAW